MNYNATFPEYQMFHKRIKAYNAVHKPTLRRGTKHIFIPLFEMTITGMLSNNNFEFDEAKLIEKLKFNNCPIIPTLLDIFKKNDISVMIEEYRSRFRLSDFSENIEHLRQGCLDTIQSIQNIHDCGIIIISIRPELITFKQTNQGLKVSAIHPRYNRFKDATCRAGSIGSIPFFPNIYIAREILNKTPLNIQPSIKSDVFSLALTIHYWLTDHYLYKKKTPFLTALAYYKNDCSSWGPRWKSMEKIITRALSRNPADRPEVMELYEAMLHASP